MTTKPEYPIPTALCLSLITKELTRVGDARLRPLNLATAQLPILDGLKDGWALTQADLVRLAKAEQSSMAQLLARMQRDGIIRRDCDPDDRSSSFVMLTEETRAKVPAIRAILKKSNAELTAGFSDTRMVRCGCRMPRQPTIGGGGQRH